MQGYKKLYQQRINVNIANTVFVVDFHLDEDERDFNPCLEGRTFKLFVSCFAFQATLFLSFYLRSLTLRL